MLVFGKINKQTNQQRQETKIRKKEEKKRKKEKRRKENNVKQILQKFQNSTKHKII